MLKLLEKMQHDKENLLIQIGILVTKEYDAINSKVYLADKHLCKIVKRIYLLVSRIVATTYNIK